MYVPTTKKEREAIERNRSLQQLQRKNTCHFFYFVLFILHFINDLIFFCNFNDVHYEIYQSGLLLESLMYSL